jgi:thioredoxin 1
MNLATTQKRWFEDEKWKLKETTASPPLRLLLEDDPQKQARGVWQIEQRIESTSTPAANQAALIKTANTTQQRKEHLTPTSYVAKLQKTFDSILDDASIDYTRLTKHCYALLEDFRKYVLEHRNAIKGVTHIRYEPTKEGTSKDFGLLRMVADALSEAKAVREMGLYSYIAGDGDDKAVNGSNRDTEDQWRHGMGLLTASKVFKRFLAKTDKIDFQFPLGLLDPSNSYDDIDDKTPLGKQLTADMKRGKVHNLATASELEAFLATTTYAIVTFWTDYDGTHKNMGLKLAELSRKYAEPGLFEFSRANADDMIRYCKWEGKQSFVAFKDGKQVAVNGEPYIQGPKTKALKAAAEKLGLLAKKKLVERQQTTVD